MSTSTGRRLSPQARRAQLLALGVQMLGTRPLEAISVDEIAEQAGVSRGLLFHYFSSKQDFHLAVVEEVSAALLRATEPGPDEDPVLALRASVSAYVDFVAGNHDAYRALLRGPAGRDPALVAVFERTRSAMARRTLDAGARLGLPEGPRARLAVRGWLAFTEEVVLGWAADHEVTRDELLDLVVAAFSAARG